MKKTAYATQLAEGRMGEMRIERLLVKKTGAEEIRASWWPNGNFAIRPVDMPEENWVKLLDIGFKKGVLSSKFALDLIKMAAKHI